jgi:hypothetical protein
MCLSSQKGFFHSQFFAGGYTRLAREQWMLLKNAHPGYISWEQYEENSVASRKTRKPSEPTGGRVRRAKAQHCCKAWWCAAYAGAG